MASQFARLLVRVAICVHLASRKLAKENESVLHLCLHSGRLIYLMVGVVNSSYAIFLADSYVV